MIILFANSNFKENFMKNEKKQVGKVSGDNSLKIA